MRVRPHAQQHDVQWNSQPLDHASRIVHKQRKVRHQSPDRCLTRRGEPTNSVSLTRQNQALTDIVNAIYSLRQAQAARRFALSTGI
jgi:hypothetical protein